MAGQKIEPYGQWLSPITTDLIVRKFIGFSELHLYRGNIFWNESRPSEGGRNVVVKREADGSTVDIIPGEFNARTRVHEYGGGSYFIYEDEVYFSNFEDQRIHRIGVGGAPEPFSGPGNLRYADFNCDYRRKRVYCVREEHRDEFHEPINTIVSIDIKKGGNGFVLVSGNDFYSSPRISPDGNHLAWITWNHPNMPWDGTELWCADIDEKGLLSNPRRITGGISDSIFQPEWSPDGILYFISDRSGWWNIYRYNSGKIENICNMKAEFGVPQWVFGLSTYGFMSENSIVCSYEEDGRSKLARIDLNKSKLIPVKIPYTYISSLKVKDNEAYFIAGSPLEPTSIVNVNLDSEKIEVIRMSGDISVGEGFLSKPEEISFPAEDEKRAFGLYYPPKNKEFKAPPGELPPLIVISHGGPTSSIANVLSLKIQFWTSRGFAILNVNYGGSTGYGREYRNRLKGKWGIVDVDDCVSGAEYLIEKGLVDVERVIIRGGSAGGYTTLSALTFRDFFTAGASYFGVSDLEALTLETHKFESRYLDGLIGPYPDRKDLYFERSPIHHVENLSSPIIFLQGLEDKVVSPNQAEKMVSALRNKGVPVAYVQFEKEQHGFRRAENIKRAFESELYFYSKIFGFKPADRIAPVEIENL